MPAAYTFPGVYVEEISSGVRTITGVSTSVTAFVGTAKRGPIDRAVHIPSYSDFERQYGGLATDSEMTYAVRQFFLNGGSDAWVVRLAKNAVAASLDLLPTAGTSLKVIALEEGTSGLNIEVRVDYNTDNPASTFNLTFNYADPASPADNRSERFTNLSMNKNDPRYALDMINDISQLVTIVRQAPDLATGQGTSQSGTLGDVATLLDATHNQFRVSVDNAPPVTVLIDLPADVAGANPAAHLATLCTRIAAKVQAASGGVAVLTAAPSGNTILLTSATVGEKSSVRVLPGLTNDAASRLLLGTAYGGVETDAAASIRPVEIPPHGTLTSDVLALGDLGTLPDATHTGFLISLDGYGPDPIDLGTTAAAGATLATKMPDLASRIQTAVRALKPSNPAYSGFTAASITGNTQLLLSSGTRGTGSSVQVSAATTNDLAGSLKLLAGATAVRPLNANLQGGSESAFTEGESYSIFIADRSQRKGIYALEAVDLFNILCLPGVRDSGILSDAAAYARERRAFMIIDAPTDKKKPQDMVSTIQGTALPKTDNAAVYYPWIKIADPLNNGKLKTVAPSGTIAGLYARTDSARGVWKAPAGTEANLVGAQGADYVLTDLENGTLNPLGVNVIRVLPVYGTVAWGARTLRGADQMTSEYKYIPIRRLAYYIEESLYRGTQWVVFEPNDEPLWAQIRLNIGAFMQNLFRQGAFQGRTPREAYFVKCDKETTTQNDINLGIVNILVGFAPLKPAEFVVIKLQQIAGQIEV